MMALLPEERLRCECEGPGTAATKVERQKRVILLAGCAQQVCGRTSTTPPSACSRAAAWTWRSRPAPAAGALVHHMGREAAAIEQAKANVDAWTKVGGAILVNACSATATCWPCPPSRGQGTTTWPSSCRAEARAVALVDLAHGLSFRLSMQGARPARRRRAEGAAAQGGFRGAGSAGRAHLLRLGGRLEHPQPEIAGDLGRRKARNIESVRRRGGRRRPCGCIAQIKTATPIPVVHTVELLD